MSVEQPIGLATPVPLEAPSVRLSRREKAAVVARLLLTSGAVPAVSELPENLQTELVVQIARMGPVDQVVVDEVAEEFANQIERIGLSFPSGLDGALGLLDGVISSGASSRVRNMTNDAFAGDPWDALGAVDDDRLFALIEHEAVEVTAIILSMLKVSKAASLLGKFPGERARRIAYSVSLTGSVAPDVVRRIGVTLAEQLNTRPARAFAEAPVSRVGAILNYAAAAVRDEVLDGLDSEDADFAEQVRRAIFTFANVKDRVSPSDIPRIQRDIDQADLVTAVAVAEGDDLKSIDFMLENISKRLAESIRDEAKDRKNVSAADGEEAMRNMVNTIRELESAGEIYLITGED